MFGSRDRSGRGLAPLANQVWKFLANKHFGDVYVVRAVGEGSAKASFVATTIPTNGDPVLLVEAANIGAWGNDIDWQVAPATDGDVQHFDFLVRYQGVGYRATNCSCSGTEDNLAARIATVWDADAALVTLTKLGPGRPFNTGDLAASHFGGFLTLGETLEGFVTTAGADVAPTDNDVIAVGRGLEMLANTPGIAVVAVAERMSNSIRTKIRTLASAVTDRTFLIGPNSETTTATMVPGDTGANKSDRLIYCFNHYFTLDPETSQEMLCRPESLMASILSQTDVDIHPGDPDNTKYASAITRLYYDSLSRGDYILLHDAGAAALENDEGGFLFVSGRCTDRSEITLRRQKDYLIKAMVNFLKTSVKKKNTPTRRAANAAALRAFLGDLQREERMVEDYIVDANKLNTKATRALGLEKMLVRVRLISHALYIVLVPEIGTTVVITEQLAA